MRIFRALIFFFGLALIVADYHPTLRADEWDKTTKITFREPVQVPGAVLQPGTYLFRLADSNSNRHIVQIFNEDHTSLITTILAIPNYQLTPSDKTLLEYAERPADQPVALEAWFYPGDNFGQQFVYPKSQAELLSRLNRTEVPSTGEEEAYNRNTEQRAAPSNPPSNTETRPQPAPENAQPEPQSPPPQPSQTSPPPANPAPNPAVSQSNPQPAPRQQPQQLPQTSSLLPLIGLLGLAFLSIALLLRLTIRA